MKNKIRRKQNVIARDLRTPKFRQRRIELKKLRDSAQQARKEIEECLTDLPSSQQQLLTEI
jgi:hypothetical protein